MFPRIITAKRKYGTYKYLVISESIRIKGKGSTTRDLAKLGSITNFTQKDIQDIIDGLIKLFHIEKYNLTDHIETLESLEYGSILFWRKIWNELGLSKIIRKQIRRNNKQISLEVEKYIEMMVINRCVDPLSKLGCTRWIDRTSYKLMKGYTNLSHHVEHFYRSMDYLLEIKESLEHAIFSQLRSLFSINVRLTFYDITSTFFHTDKCPISANGYSRDKRPDLKQIVIGVLTSWEGYPIKHYVFEGNTKDESTVVEVLEDIRNEYNIEETTFVGDRGMISKLNLSDITEKGFDYIMGVKHNQDEIVSLLFKESQIDENDYREYNKLKIQEKIVTIKEFLILKTKWILKSFAIDIKKVNLSILKKRIVGLTNLDELLYSDLKKDFEGIVVDKKAIRQICSLVKKYQGQYEEDLRLIICLNKERKNITKRKRDTKLNTISEELNKLFTKTKGKDSVIDIERKLNTIFKGYKSRYRKFFKISRNENTQEAIGYKLNEKAISEKEKTDGVFILTTSRSDIEIDKVVDSYKNLKEIEILFDDLKNFVDINPVRHWLEARVRAHVLICILSLLLKRVFEINYMKGKAILEALEEISKLKFVKYKVKFSEREERYRVVPSLTKLTDLQKKYFKMVGIKNPSSIENLVWW
ncbi:MAG: IS1634 family transposase [archaeon]|nr:IS1634 family transposase [archaeon]